MSQKINCKHCNREVEIEVKTCQHCSFENPGKIQGELVFLSIIGIIVSIVVLKGEILIAGTKILTTLIIALNSIPGNYSSI